MSVVIETTLGDMTVDLFIEERPNTCLNFLKLCKIKYYNLSLFHTVQHNFIAQTGDPTGTGKNGESVYSKLYGEKAKYYEAEAMPKLKHCKAGLVSMVNCGNNMLGSQFFFTLSGDLQSLDGQHCVFGEVVEGHDTLLRLNETICDLDNRPYQDIRIKHTVILVDPYDDPPGLPVPDASPLPSAETLVNGRIGPDEQIDEAQGLTAAEVDEIVKTREAKAQATILEIVGDLPDADVAPPENVLFVCKLNPVTSDDDLEIIFSRFGRVKSCEVIRDKNTGDSLQYAFVEFEDRKACEEAFFKMDNVLIDDRRIHVDFSQSVSKYRWKGKGRGVEETAEGNEQHAESRRHSPETHHKREDVAQHNTTGSAQIRKAEVLQVNSHDLPDLYAEHCRKEGSREQERRERSRNSERDKQRLDQRTNSSERDRRRRDDSDRVRRTGERRRESSRERERQRRSNDVDRDRHRKDRKRDSDHERIRNDRSRDSDHEKSRSDRTRDSDREHSRSDRVRDSDRERSRSDRNKDSEYDRTRNSRPAEESDRSRSDKKAESKSKDVKNQHEGKSSVGKEHNERMGSSNNMTRQAEKDKIPSVKMSQNELKTDPSLQNRKSEEKVINIKTSEETVKKQNALDKLKRSEKLMKDVYETEQDLERHDKEYGKESKMKGEEKQADKLDQSDSEQVLKSVHNESEMKNKLEVVESRHWQKCSQDVRKKKNNSEHHSEHRGSTLKRANMKKKISESDRSDGDDSVSDESESEVENDKKPNKFLASKVGDKDRHQNVEAYHIKARKGSDTEDSQVSEREEAALLSSKKKRREHACERVRSSNKRRAEQSPHSVKKKRWRKQSSSSSDSEESSSSDSSSNSSVSSSDSAARNSKARIRKTSKKHSLPAKKIKKLKMVKRKKKRLRRIKHSDSDSSSESSDSSDYKKKYIKLKKKNKMKRRKNISSDDSSSDDGARKRRERKKKSKPKKKPSTSEDSEEEGASESSDSSYQKLLRKHKKRLAAEKKAKKSRRELKLNKKKNNTPRKRQHSEQEEQSSSNESAPKIVKKDPKKNNGVEGKKVRKEEAVVSS